MEGAIEPSRRQIAARLWRLVTRGEPDYLFGRPDRPVAAENAASALVAQWTDALRGEGAGHISELTPHRVAEDVQVVMDALGRFRDRARQAVVDLPEPWESLRCSTCLQPTDTLYTDRYVRNGCAICRAKAKDGRDPSVTLVPAGS